MAVEDDELEPFGPIPPELAGLLLAVGQEAAEGARHLADTWYVRPTPDLREEALEILALTTMVSLVADADELKTRAHAWQAPDEVIRALEPVEEIKAHLPFTASELVLLREVTVSWDYKSKSWRQPLLEEAQAQIDHWRSWLREPEPDPETGELFVNSEAGLLYLACVSLYYRLTKREIDEERLDR
jgi:hypothetical protein